MDNNENRKDILPGGQDRQIQLVVNRPNSEESSINLGNVFHNMKLNRRVYAWVLVLCLTLGFCIPLLYYQIRKPMLKVSSVVTLRYDAPVKVLEKGKDGEKDRWVVPEDPEYAPVSDLSAPDGSALDLNQITSSYVLQTALNGMSLSKSVSIGALRSNISIHTMMTEESQRKKEALAGLVEAKNAEAYKQLQDAEIKYQNRFVVSLDNGFKESEESRTKTELTDGELRVLLDRILSVYNDYLVMTYADMKLPEDTFSMIDTYELDVPESVDRLRSGVQTLYDYCNEKTDAVKAYRSWQTGRSLQDWIETLETFRSINVDYLYAMVNMDGVTKDRTALLTSWKYALQTAERELETINANITETKNILGNYKNDEIFVPQQQTETAKTTVIVTDSYNKMVFQQIKNYAKVADLKTRISVYKDRIARLESIQGTAVTEEIEAELARSVASTQEIYKDIRSHMEELVESKMYTAFIDHSAAQGQSQNFLSASAKLIIICVVAFAILGFGCWFMAALLSEFSKNRKEEKIRKEAVTE